MVSKYIQGFEEEKNATKGINMLDSDIVGVFFVRWTYFSLEFL